MKQVQVNKLPWVLIICKTQSHNLVMIHIVITKCCYCLGRHLLHHSHHGYASQISNGYETSAATEIIHGEEKKKKKKHKKVGWE